MLRPKALTQVLSQANTGGVIATLLLNKEGVLLAYSGYGDENACISAAIASSIWNNYEKCGQSFFELNPLDSLVLSCEDGQVAVCGVANLLLCMLSDDKVPLGMLKLKLKSVADYLHVPLTQISAA